MKDLIKCPINFEIYFIINTYLLTKLENKLTNLPNSTQQFNHHRFLLMFLTSPLCRATVERRLYLIVILIFFVSLIFYVHALVQRALVVVNNRSPALDVA